MLTNNNNNNNNNLGSTRQNDAEMPCELNDWEWMKFKKEFDLSTWTLDRIGNRRIGVALIGLGRMGLIHMRNILREPRAKLLYCFDADQSRLDTCSKSVYLKDSSTKTLHSDQFDMALSDPNVGAIVIATPTICHEDLTRRALMAGKSVLCEKPLTLHTDGIMPLYELARQKQVYLLTGFNRHYDPDWRMLEHKAKSGSIGPIQMIRIVSRNGQRPPVSYLRVSGDIFHDTCIHDLDMMLWLMGQLPESIQVAARTWEQYYADEPELLNELCEDDRNALADINDYFMAIMTLKFANGSLGVIDTSRHANYGNDQRCEIYGTRGMIKCDGRYPINVMEYNENGIMCPGINYNFQTRYGPAYVAELEDLLTMADLSMSGAYGNEEKVRQHLIERPRGTLVAAAMTLADACPEAAKSGRAVPFDWPQEFRHQFEAEIQT